MSTKDISGRNVPTGGGQGEVKPSFYKSMNKYPKLTHKIYTTARYGDIFPTFCFHGTRGDKVPLNSSHELDTYTLKSPLKSDVRLNKTYVKVPYKAIYPHCWDLMRVPPTSGDDIPEDSRAIFPFGAYIHGLMNNISSLSQALSLGTLSIPFFQTYLGNILKCVISLENFVSEGSLLSSFNIHLSDYFFKYYFPNSTNVGSDINFDSVFQRFYERIISVFDSNLPYYFTVHFGDESDPSSLVSYNVSSDSIRSNSVPNCISFRTALDLMRSENFTITLNSEISVTPKYSDLFFSSDLGFDDSSLSTSLDVNLNIEPIISYQLACYQFFTDDKVDFIYDAHQYRSMILSLWRTNLGLTAPLFFDWNGFKYEYDVFAGAYFYAHVNSDHFSTSLMGPGYPLMISLFGHRRSLRYKDYFTSARPQPLANGEYYSAEVNNGEVSAVKMAESMQRVRFYHNVSLAGRRLADYLQMIVPGNRIDAPDDQPLWLTHESFVIKGFEVENTGSEQLSTSPDANNIITTNLKSSASKFSFMTEVDDQCIILGLGSFDIARIYSRTINRFAFHMNRYDDFIPQLQFIGDQAVYDKELGKNLDAVEPIPFGYQVRNKEYKEMYSYASGGFVNSLPSWAFITDNKDGVPAPDTISPLYIRAIPSEFDRFYKSLTGYSLASYFHFILVIKNDLSNCERAMIPAPEILK